MPTDTINRNDPADLASGADPTRTGASASDPAPGSRAPIVILNQYYVPDVASTGYLLHELATELVNLGYDVSATTCRPSYGPPESWVSCPRKEKLNGVQVHRMWTTRLSKDSNIGRAINYLTFITQLAVRMLVTSSPRKVYLYTTNPPFLGVIGAVVSLFRRHRYVILLHDAYPQMAVWVGTIKEGGLIERVWKLANRFAYRRAEQTIVLCDAAKTLVCENNGIDPSRVHVIPNWADGQTLYPMPKADSQYARKNGLIEPFTVMYSGNLGLYYEFGTILDTAQNLRDEPFRLVLIGSGGKKAWLTEQIRSRGLTNTTIHPYQPFETLNDSLTACDASLVTIAKGIEGISYPSKLYSSLAVGRPILAISEPHSDLRKLVEQEHLGRWVELGDADRLTGVIRDMMSDPESCRKMGLRAREVFQERYTRLAATTRYAEVLDLAAPVARTASRRR
jgi:glycosyltransferase involved in cell wall biosynthesis